MAEELRELRLAKSIPAKDMVTVVQALYPKYDKTVQSKCENGDAYGVVLRQDAMDALYARFAPELKEALQRRRKDRHRLTCRISARLESELFQALQQRMEADGYATAQEWITAMATRYADPDAGWIPVGDSVPDSAEDVLFVLAGGEQPIKTGIRVENGRWWTGGEWYEADEVTHWRRLPEKPKGVDGHELE